MAAFPESIKLHIGERINPSLFCNLSHQDDSKLPVERRSAASTISFTRHFKYENGIDVPETVVKILPGKPPEPPYNFSQEYFTLVEKSKEDYDKTIEYDCDEEDYFWLDLANDRRKQIKEKLLNSDVLCTVMDRLEKECRFEVRNNCTTVVAGTSVDGDDVCCVCNDGEVNNVNQIIYCDLCNIAVHQDCYGVPYIPEGQWLCRRCKLSPSTPVSCCLCPNQSGAFKQTSDGRWAHVICAIWLNEVHFGNAVFLEPIEGIEASLKRRCKLKCLVCRQKMGACLQCSTRSCLKAFHVTCAQQSGMAMKVCAKPDPSSADQMDVQRFVYCHLHADDEIGDSGVRKKRMDDAIRQARRSIVANNTTTPCVNSPLISRDAAKQISARVEVPIYDIVQYWILKRKSRFGVPLIRRLQADAIQKVSRVSVNHSELTEEDRSVLDGFVRCRCSLETARLLSEQIKKREMHKRSFIRMSAEFHDKFFMDNDSILEASLEKLSYKDKTNVFAEPVTVDGYKALIKHPMDLQTMKKKLHNDKYKCVGDLRTDFLLMTDNCEKFNQQNDWYLKYGRKYKKSGLAVLEHSEELHRNLEALRRDPEIHRLEEAATMIMLSDNTSYADHTDSQDERTEEEEDDDEEEDVKERQLIEMANQKPELRSSRRSSMCDTATASTSMPSPALPSIEEEGEKNTPGSSLAAAAAPIANGNLFLSKGEVVKLFPSTPINGATPKTKRKNDSMTTPTTKRKKNEPVSASSAMRQMSITKFFATSPVAVACSDRKSSLRHSNNASTAPLMLFRDNSIDSPLAADVASESSADEEETKRSRKSIRLDQAKMDIQESSESEGFQHNDIVAVNGMAGRIIDPQRAKYEEKLPKGLQNDCNNCSKAHSHLCVYLFGNENKWGWYMPDDLRLLNVSTDKDCDGILQQSLNSARSWYKRITENHLLSAK